MFKTDLVEKVSKQAGLSNASAEKAVNAVIDTITDALADGDKVTLIGFGTFETRQRAARKGRNPQTKSEITIPAKRAAAFKVGKKLADAVK